MTFATTKVIVRGVESGMSAILTVVVNRTLGSLVDVDAAPEYLTDAERAHGE